jgi:hypothetical protein
VLEELDRINTNLTVPCSGAPEGSERVQLGVAVVHKMRPTGESTGQEAVAFAEGLFHECECTAALYMYGTKYVRGGGGEAFLMRHTHHIRLPASPPHGTQQGTSAQVEAVRQGPSSSSQAPITSCTSPEAVGWNNISRTIGSMRWGFQAGAVDLINQTIG